MALRDKVLWEEGMFLAPQHFQQWDRHQSTVLDERIKAIQPNFWGFTSIDVNEDALAGGEFILNGCRGVFHDGTAFHIPDVDPGPGNRRIAEAFDPAQPELDVLLALPKGRHGSMVTDPEKKDRSIARFTREVMTVVDENTGALERDIASTRKNLRILFGGEPTDDYQTLPLARLQRAPSGAFSLSSTFVPPSLYLAASPVLIATLRRIFELLSAKSEELSSKRGQRIAGAAQFSVTEATGFWLLHTVNSYLPLVMHHYHEPRVHPELVYRTLACLVGELCTFSTDGKHPKNVPLYEHSNPGPTFATLESEIRSLPETLVPERCVPVPLTAASADTSHGRVHDESLFDRGSFYLAVKADVPADKVIREIPFLAKVSSPAHVQEIRNLAVRGVAINHVPSPPTDILARSGFHYFELTKGGEHWDAVRETRTFAIFVPEQFVDVQLELMAVKQD